MNSATAGLRSMMCWRASRFMHHPCTTPNEYGWLPASTRTRRRSRVIPQVWCLSPIELALYKCTPYNSRTILSGFFSSRSIRLVRSSGANLPSTALSMHSVCTQCGQSVCTQYALSVHSLCTVSAHAHTQSITLRRSMLGVPLQLSPVPKHPSPSLVPLT